MIARLDPPGCGCTDCLTGHSRPIDVASNEELAACARGQIENATGYERVTVVPWEGLLTQSNSQIRKFASLQPADAAQAIIDLASRLRITQDAYTSLEMAASHLIDMLDGEATTIGTPTWDRAIHELRQTLRGK